MACACKAIQIFSALIFLFLPRLCKEWNAVVTGAKAENVKCGETHGNGRSSRRRRHEETEEMPESVKWPRWSRRGDFLCAVRQWRFFLRAVWRPVP